MEIELCFATLSCCSVDMVDVRDARNHVYLYYGLKHVFYIRP
jgi:hypothetical protein